MKNILYVCDFNSIHSRNLIKAVRETTSNNITVLSSYDAQEMDGVKVIPLNQGGFGDKSGMQGIAALILRWAPNIYRIIVTYFLAKRTKNSVKKLSTINIPDRPDIIHALRTQPEGIIACELNKKYKSLFLLTTWGQDFTLWSKLNFWLSSKTKEVLNNVDIFIPDNFRDEKIIKTISNNDNFKTKVLPATGGLDFDYMDSLEPKDIQIKESKYSFLTTRGYENSYVKLSKVINAFEKFHNDNPDSHLYIDLHSKTDESKDEDLQEVLTKKGLKDSVTLLHLNRDEMFYYMSKCRFNVSVTFSDGMPLSLLESLYFGQIPIVSDHASTRILGDQFENYHSFSDYNQDTIFNAWKVAALDADQSQSDIMNRNRKELLKTYSRRENVKQILDLYEFNK